MFDGTAGLDSPLTGTRVTVLGTLTKTDDPALVARYTARHPESKMFAGFADFNLYEMAVERAHIVAGFGVIHWVDPADLLFDTFGFEDLAEAENDIVTHMNEDHADAVGLYATSLLGLDEGDWIMTGVDPEDATFAMVELWRASTLKNLPITLNPARSALVRLVKAARATATS